MWAIVLGVLLIPALCALFARGATGVFASAALPGALCAYSLFRLCELNQDGPACGLGAGIVIPIAVATGLSTAAALAVGALRYLLSLAFSRRCRGGLEFYTERPQDSLLPGVGLTPEP